MRIFWKCWPDMQCVWARHIQWQERLSASLWFSVSLERTLAALFKLLTNSGHTAWHRLRYQKGEAKDYIILPYASNNTEGLKWAVCHFYTSAACETKYNCQEYTDMLFPVRSTNLIFSVHIAYISHCISFQFQIWAGLSNSGGLIFELK